MWIDDHVGDRPYGVDVIVPGDTVKVHVRVVEGTRERVQVFQGVVIARSGGGIRETFTVRKISAGVGVEPVAHQTARRRSGCRVSCASSSAASRQPT